jgi:hypothetical protein
MITGYGGGSATLRLYLGGGHSDKLKKNLVKPPITKERMILSISNEMEGIHCPAKVGGQSLPNGQRVTPNFILFFK